jgi:hypothetical protein
MKERPILFSGAMVRAILDGRKTQTRRLMTPQPIGNGFKFIHNDLLCHVDHLPPSATLWKRGTKRDPYWSSDVEDDWTEMSPFGVPGDRLWVRETFYCDDVFAGDYSHGDEEQWRRETYYRADGELHDQMAEMTEDDPSAGRSYWRPSIHMPRWASRLTLEITDVRVERLQDISEADALAEGVDPLEWSGGPANESARAAFRELWESLNAHRAPWSSSPWVWVLSFRRVESADTQKEVARG